MEGKLHSEETEKLISEKKKGIKLTDEHKKILSAIKKGIKKETKICLYCKKVGAGPAMDRWHFNNCKNKK